MTKSITLISAAILYIFFGLVFLIIPQIMPGLMAFTMSTGAEMVARSYGGLLAGIGVANWLIRNKPPRNHIPLILGNLIWQLFSTYAILRASLTGAVNWLGYAFAGIHVLWAIGFAVLLFGKESTPSVKRGDSSAA